MAASRRPASARGARRPEDEDLLRRFESDLLKQPRVKDPAAVNDDIDYLNWLEAVRACGLSKALRGMAAQLPHPAPPAAPPPAAPGRKVRLSCSSSSASSKVSSEQLQSTAPASSSSGSSRSDADSVSVYSSRSSHSVARSSGSQSSRCALPQRPRSASSRASSCALGRSGSVACSSSEFGNLCDKFGDRAVMRFKSVNQCLQFLDPGRTGGVQKENIVALFRLSYLPDKDGERLFELMDTHRRGEISYNQMRAIIAAYITPGQGDPPRPLHPEEPDAQALRSRPEERRREEELRRLAAAVGAKVGEQRMLSAADDVLQRLDAEERGSVQRAEVMAFFARFGYPRDVGNRAFDLLAGPGNDAVELAAFMDVFGPAILSGWPAPGSQSQSGYSQSTRQGRPPPRPGTPLAAPLAGPRRPASPAPSSSRPSSAGLVRPASAQRLGARPAPATPPRPARPARPASARRARPGSASAARPGPAAAASLSFVVAGEKASKASGSSTSTSAYSESDGGMRPPSSQAASTTGSGAYSGPAATPRGLVRSGPLWERATLFTPASRGPTYAGPVRSQRMGRRSRSCDLPGVKWRGPLVVTAPASAYPERPKAPRTRSRPSTPRVGLYGAPPPPMATGAPAFAVVPTSADAVVERAVAEANSRLGSRSRSAPHLQRARPRSAGPTMRRRYDEPWRDEGAIEGEREEETHLAAAAGSLAATSMA